MTKTYAISTVLGIMIVRADNPTEAFVTYSTSDGALGDICLSRDDLLKRGYVKMRPTKIDNVFEIMKKDATGNMESVKV